MWLPKFWNYHPVLDEKSKSKSMSQSGSGSELIEKSTTDCISTTKAIATAVSTSATNEYSHSTKKMGSSAITNILPRMERLNGPYGMYATVYGVSTKVVHVAHPIPARIFLGTTTTNANGNVNLNATNGTTTSKMNKKNTKRKNNGVAYSLGAIKNPAYDHFDNLFGKAVFTADGTNWKLKRASVLHCLLKGCTKDESKESLKLEKEANVAADCFMTFALLKSSSSSSSKQQQQKAVNIVSLLQRSTIGLIYRFLTHHDVNVMLEEEQKGNDTVYGTVTSTNSVESTIVSSEKVTLDKDLCISSKRERRQNTDDDNDDDSTNSTTSLSSSISSPAINSLIEKEQSSKTANTDTTKNPFTILSSYLEAITNIRMIILAQSRSIWFLLPRWVYRLCSPMYKEEERQMKTIREFAQSACLNAQPGSPLHSLRSRKSHNPMMDNNVCNGKFVNKELLDEAITLLFAGQDTSAATLSWTLHLLSLYPKVQKRLAKEVCDALSSNNDDNNDNEKGNHNYRSYQRIRKKMVMNLPYLDAVLKESMRLYPVAPFVVRSVPDELVISGDSDIDGSDNPTRTRTEGEVTIPKDSLACIWIYGLHRNKKCWHRPNDFLPERWIDPSLQKLDIGQRNGSFMPFAAGPRNCVGQPLAQIVLRIILAKVVYTCEFHDERVDGFSKLSLTDDEMLKATLPLRKDMQAGFTVLPTGGVYVNVKERKID
jgi:hypothetical protein